MSIAELEETRGHTYGGTTFSKSLDRQIYHEFDRDAEGRESGRFGRSDPRAAPAFKPQLPFPTFTDKLEVDKLHIKYSAVSNLRILLAERVVGLLALTLFGEAWRPRELLQRTNEPHICVCSV